ncbi:MAG: nicotinate-nucleotide adenylyltransferase [Clostridiales bacterium]|nr:nicotinate-nucleotide adenylyltransferase [Clostridiales bacterium]
MSNDIRRLGILGGTFNPVHNGHLRMAEYAMAQFGLNKVIFIPTGHTAYKEFSGEEMTEHRCRMVELAIEGHPEYILSRMETEHDAVNYSYLTLQEINKGMADRGIAAELYFIIGGDSLKDFPTWKHPELICREATILATGRYGLRNKELDRQIERLSKKYDAKILRFDMPAWTSSSRDIRDMVAHGESISGWVPAEVEEYIIEHRLYA